MAQDPRPEDDLDQWLDQLSGRQPAEPSMQSIRQTLRRIGPELMENRLGVAGTVQAEQQALQRLVARLDQEMAWPLHTPEHEPVLQVAKTVGRVGPRGPWRWPWISSAGLVLAVAVWWLLRPAPMGNESGWPVLTEAPPAYRGDVEGLRQPSAQPLVDAQALARQLSPWAQGLVLYWHDEQATVDFELAPEAVEAARTAISGRVAAALKPGLNRLVFYPAL